MRSVAQIDPDEYVARYADSRDPRDDFQLEHAQAHSLNCVVTGDQDLLVLHPFGDIQIVSPAAFLKMLDADER